MWSSLTNDVFNEKKPKIAIFLLKKYHRYSIVRSRYSSILWEVLTQKTSILAVRNSRRSIFSALVFLIHLAISGKKTFYPFLKKSFRVNVCLGETPFLGTKNRVSPIPIPFFPTNWSSVKIINLILIVGISLSLLGITLFVNEKCRRMPRILQVSSS